MDIYLLNELNKLEAGGAGGSTGLTAFLPNTLDETKTANQSQWVSISRNNPRDNLDNQGWSSNNAHTSHYVYLNGAYDYEFHFADALGKLHADHVNSDSRSNYATGSKPEVHFAKNNTVGYWGFTTVPGSSTSYAPFRSMVMFIKNPTSSSISTTLYGALSSYWSSGHDGAGVVVGTPNNTDNAAVTSLSWSKLWNGAGSNGYLNNWNGTLTVPANTTVVVIAAGTNYYWTGTTYQYYYSSDMNSFNNLQVLSDAGLECDLEMTISALQHRDSFNSAANNAYRIWNATARAFPPEPA